MRNPFDRPRAVVARWLNGLRARWQWFDHLARAARSLPGPVRRPDRRRPDLLRVPVLLPAAGRRVLGGRLPDQPSTRRCSSQVESDAERQLPRPGRHRQEPAARQHVLQRQELDGRRRPGGLIWTGLGWLDAVRSGLRVMWGMAQSTTNFALLKLNDLGLLAAIGLSLLISLTIAGFGAAYSGAAARLGRAVRLADRQRGDQAGRAGARLPGRPAAVHPDVHRPVRLAAAQAAAARSAAGQPRLRGAQAGRLGAARPHDVARRRTRPSPSASACWSGCTSSTGSCSSPPPGR